MIKYFKGLLKVVLVIAGILALGVALFFLWFEYTSPVSEAGREYARNVRSYQNDDIRTLDDVYERLDVLDAHFNSTTFDKVQDADKREVTLSDIETLFGEPHEVMEEADMYYADTVYQYTYDDLTINFHERFRTIDEYVIENFTETLYNSNTLDRLFIEAVVNHQTQAERVDDQFESLTKEDVTELLKDNTPTRNIRQSGWHTWPYNRQDYFDDGSGNYSPEEYLSFQFQEEDETELYLMERRYRAVFLEKDTQEETEQKKEALYAFSDFFDQEESNPSEEKLLVEDFSDELGGIARMMYDFNRGVLGVAWVMTDGEYTEEIIATAPITDVSTLSDVENLAELEVVEFRTQLLSITDNILNTDAFIGSR